MKVDRSEADNDLSSIPAEFRENYRFLTELINCDEKNKVASNGLEGLVNKHLRRIRGSLNRRQMAILNRCLKEEPDTEGLVPPVPAELEASIRIKKRVVWLPWEAEAIRKIDRWRADIVCIMKQWANEKPVSVCSKVEKTASGKLAAGSKFNN